MAEDRLSPQLGRLIDEAKAAARRTDLSFARAEGVALLIAGGAIHAGYQGADPAFPLLSAADVALATARKAGDAEIQVAAVAVVDDPAETVVPSAECRQTLAGIDPELPVVFKSLGRWVQLPLSELPPCI